MTQPNEIRALLEKAVTYLKQGNKQQAEQCLLQVIRMDPENVIAWYGLANVLDDPLRKKDCLRRVLALNPQHERARALLARLETPTTPETALSQKTITAQPSASLPTKVTSPAPKRNQAGASTRAMERERRNKGLNIGLAGLGILGFILIISLTRPEWNGGAIGFGLLIIVLALPKMIIRKVDLQLDESRRAARGAQAEEKIGALLACLGPNFVVLNDVECAYGNIDHLVIASNGAVFMIETKSHHGTVTVQENEIRINGHAPEKNFIAQSLRNSFWLRDLLEPYAGTKPWVTAILVFTNAFVHAPRPVKSVIVVNKKYLLETIRRGANRARPLPGIWKKQDEIVRMLA